MSSYTGRVADQDQQEFADFYTLPSDNSDSGMMTPFHGSLRRSQSPPDTGYSAEFLPTNSWDQAERFWAQQAEAPPDIVDPAPLSSTVDFDSGVVSNLRSVQSDVPPSSTSQETAPGSSRDGSRPSTKRYIRRAWTIWRPDHKCFDDKGAQVPEQEGNGPWMKMVNSTNALTKFLGVDRSGFDMIIQHIASTNPYPVFGLQPVSMKPGDSGELMWLMKSYPPYSHMRRRHLTDAERQITTEANEFEREKRHVLLKINVKRNGSRPKGQMGIDERVFWPKECNEAGGAS